MKINDAYGELQASYIDWDGLFKDPNYFRTNAAVSWRDAAGLVLNDPVTVGVIRDLSNRRQFSFRVASDDSLVQLGYRFDREGELTAARLAFYKLPTPEITDDLAVRPALDDDPSNQVSWLRLDFIEAINVRVGHTPCHVHLCGFPSVRFAVFGVPSPSQFIEFIVSHFYPAEYASARLAPDGTFDNYEKINRINGRATKAGLEPRKLLRCLPHLVTPGN